MRHPHLCRLTPSRTDACTTAGWPAVLLSDSLPLALGCRMSTTQIPPLRVEHGPYLSGFPDPRMTKLWRSDFCSQRHRYRVRSPAFESQRERGSGYMGGSGACGSNATLPVPLQGPLQLEE